MYLPLAPSGLLPFLQLPLSLWGSVQTTLDSAVPNAVCHDHKDLLNILGNVAPYHDAPSVPGVSANLPSDCSVDRVVLLHRHGSRGPLGHEKFIFKLIDTLDKARDVIQAADLPPCLEFLKEGYKYDLIPEELTVIGRKELFGHGIEFALRYPKLTTDEVVSTTVPRVMESAHFFNQGFFGLEADKIRFLTTDNFTDPMCWLGPWDACPKLSYDEPFKAARKWEAKFIPPIVERMNGLIPGVEFSFDDVRGVLYACPYDLAARNKSPWCDVLTTDELRDLEYGIDLLLDAYSGHASRGDPGPLVGAFYIKKLIERLTDTAENAKPLYLDFAHEVNIIFALSTLGLNKDEAPLSPLVDHPPAHRKFRTSNQAPFAAQMVWEKFTCEQSFEGPQVRLTLNGATLPLSICEQSEKDKQYGTCSLDAFVRANEYSVNVEYHSQVWNATCELDQ